MRSLLVHLNRRHIGTLSEGNDLWTFDYTPDWAGDPEGFDLSPALKRSTLSHQDGATLRPVQWYFDNLLPEEDLRKVLTTEAGLQGEDAFALLAYLGQESAGSLVLMTPEAVDVIHAAGTGKAGLQPLSDEVLFRRIKDLPRSSLSKDAPKRMSIAGAQHKLLVVYKDDQLYEPVGEEPSTHILKPNHPGEDYPASVINEYVVMRLAGRLKLDVPAVHRRYTPAPVYLVQRFDRFVDEGGQTQRRHIIDACQLLNQARTFKYTVANLQTLKDVILLCRNRASTRLKLFQWLVFNVLIANHDNHIKNISFLVSPEGISLAPAYDLLSTATYNTVAFAQEKANWPHVDMAVPLVGALTFQQVTRQAVVDSGGVLGLTPAICTRELNRMVKAMPLELSKLLKTIEEENLQLGEDVKPYLGGELRLLRTLAHLILPEMIGRVTASPSAG